MKEDQYLYLVDKYQIFSEDRVMKKEEEVNELISQIKDKRIGKRSNARSGKNSSTYKDQMSLSFS
jgi:hypothetical protein